VHPGVSLIQVQILAATTVFLLHASLFCMALFLPCVVRADFDFFSLERGAGCMTLFGLLVFFYFFSAWRS
jgi:hypothetical protein